MLAFFLFDFPKIINIQIYQCIRQRHFLFNSREGEFGLVFRYTQVLGHTSTSRLSVVLTKIDMFNQVRVPHSTSVLQ